MYNHKGLRISYCFADWSNIVSS